MYPLFRFMVKFGLSLLMMTVVCELVWDFFVFGSLYLCTDPPIFGFLHPGDWVHTFDGNSIQVVAHIVPDSYPGDPDSLKEGWNVTRLWDVWFGFAGVAVVVSVGLTRLPWLPDWRGKGYSK